MDKRLINVPQPSRLSGFDGKINQHSGGINAKYEREGEAIFQVQVQKEFPLLVWHPSVMGKQLAYIEGWLIHVDIINSISLDEASYPDFGPEISAVVPLNLKERGLIIYDSFLCFNTNKMDSSIRHINEDNDGPLVPQSICTHLDEKGIITKEDCMIGPLRTTLNLYNQYLALQKGEKSSFDLACYPHGDAGRRQYEMEQQEKKKEK